ncbi:hypothetical protein BJV78DRAFT_886641 [Lactifluus subvellereus]|nr:hypothetical protein BJV78DRAFT_886641 [Lactifluus subvellereus]
MVLKPGKREQWQELLAGVQELAKATSDENVQLAQKVKELEVEVTVWKQAHSAARDTQDRENKSTARSIALCVIDGTRSVFSTNYISQGGEGGRKAGQEIVRAITDSLADDKSLQDINPRLSIAIYVRKPRLRDDMVIGNFCTPEQFDDFFVGLNETPHLNIVDVGSKRDAEKKIEEYLQLFAGLPQIVRIFFSGGTGSEYLSILPTLENCTATNKLVILRSYTSPTFGTFARIPSLMLAGLFMKNVPAGHPSSVTPLPPTSPSPFPLAEPDTPDTSPWSSNAQRRQSVIDPTLPLYKQNPPPCNEYYLMEACSKEGRCRYSHEYTLTEEQIATLAKNAKQSPCWYLNNDRQCPYGESCCWGHVCPFGVKCIFTVKDKCRFKADGMHRPRGDFLLRGDGCALNRTSFLRSQYVF